MKPDPKKPSLPRYFETHQEFGYRVAGYYHKDGPQMMAELEADGWEWVEGRKHIARPPDDPTNPGTGMRPPERMGYAPGLMSLADAYLLMMENQRTQLPLGVRRRL